MSYGQLQTNSKDHDIMVTFRWHV